MTTDDLLQPTVAPSSSGNPTRPWDPDNHWWVAFFGGFWAVLAISLLNVRRFGGDVRQILPRMTLGVALGWVATFIVGGLLVLVAGVDRQSLRYLRWAFRGGAVLVWWLWLLPSQRSLVQRYEARHGFDAYAGSLLPGVAAVVVGVVVQTFLRSLIVVPLIRWAVGWGA